MLCRGPEVALFTLNGDLLLEQNVCTEDDEIITACAFYEGAGNEYIEQDLVFTGHRRGVVNVRPNRALPSKSCLLYANTSKDLEIKHPWCGLRA